MSEYLHAEKRVLAQLAPLESAYQSVGWAELAKPNDLRAGEDPAARAALATTAGGQH